VKHLIRNVRQTDTREVLRQVLAMENADEIGAFLNAIASQRIHNSKSL
jgi:hypothetical protein